MCAQIQLTSADYRAPRRRHLSRDCKAQRVASKNEREAHPPVRISFEARGHRRNRPQRRRAMGVQTQTEVGTHEQLRADRKDPPDGQAGDRKRSARKASCRRAEVRRPPESRVAVVPSGAV